MIYLVLDLDLTVFVCMPQLIKLYYGHVVSDNWINIGTESIKFINPDKLKDLIEKACLEHDGIMFLTAGTWDESLIKMAVCVHLGLCKTVSDKVNEAVFLNVQASSKHLPEVHINDIPHLAKNIRLQACIDQTPELAGAHFIVLDDSFEQILSFRDTPYVTAIHATTDINDIIAYSKFAPDVYDKPDEFYQVALNALSKVSLTQKESQAASSTQESGSSSEAAQDVGHFPSPIRRASPSQPQLQLQPDEPASDSPSPGL